MPTKFKTQFEDHTSPFQEPGSPIRIIYTPVFDKQGRMTLEESGKEDLYGYIQSHADSVDISVILTRYQQGDVSALSRIQGTYGDFTQMPKTFAEALNTLIAAESYFNSLPVDVRAKFDHDFNQFIASFDSPEVLKKLGVDLDAAAADAVSSVSKRSVAESSESSSGDAVSGSSSSGSADGG